MSGGVDRTNIAMALARLIVQVVDSSFAVNCPTTYSTYVTGSSVRRCNSGGGGDTKFHFGGSSQGFGDGNGAQRRSPGSGLGTKSPKAKPEMIKNFKISAHTVHPDS